MPTPITYVCASNSTGQLSYFTPSCPKGTTSVSVTPSATQFKGCYLTSSGVTRKVSSGTPCSDNPRKKESTIAKVPADSTSLYFCRSSSDGTLYFKGTSPPACPTGQTALVIGPHNRPPVAVADSYSTSEDTPLAVAAPGVRANDSDPDGDPFTAGVVTGPSHAASFTLNADGSFSYTPAANYNGADSFTYRDTDNHSATGNTVTVTLTVSPVNDDPVATSTSVSTSEETPKSIDLGALVSDVETSDANLTYTIVTPTAHGTYTGGVYTPSANYNGADSFTYKVTDRGDPDNCGAPSGSCAAAKTSTTETVSITVTPVNDAPSASPTSVSLNEDASQAIDLSTLVSDVETSNANLTYTVVTPPAHGTYSGGVYTPSANYNGADSFTYKVTDRGDPDNCGAASVSCAAAKSSTTQTVSITVYPVNDAPKAFPTSLSLNEDGSTAINLSTLVNDVETPVANLTYTVVTPPAHGTYSGGVYTPNANYNGADSFTYKVTDRGDPDNCGAPSASCTAAKTSTTETVSINVNPVNDAPTASPTSVSLNEDGSKPIDLSTLVSDVETSNANLTYTVVTSPPHGSYSAGTYTPNANYNGADSFTYKVTDRGDPDNCGAPSASCTAAKTSTTETISITVNPVNDGPSFSLPASPDQTVVQDSGLQTVSSFATNLSTGPANESGQTLTFHTSNDNNSLFAAQPSINSSGDLSYTPAAGQTGTATVTVYVQDNGGTANGGVDTSGSQTFKITVIPPNAAPVADAQSPSTNEDTLKTITLTASDADDDALTFSIVAGQGPSHGALGSISAPDCSAANTCSATVDYAPDSNYNGSDSFKFTVNDGTIDSAAATVSITVNAVNDAPALDNTKAPALNAENEDAGLPSGAVGTPVSALVDSASPSGQLDNVSDPDSGALLGIAVTAADAANGNWFYSVDNGASWTALGAMTNTNARLLAADANTRLYFQPHADFNGTVASAITFRAWDQTSGTSGSLADTSTNGATTAFSTAVDTASLVITAVNDAPLLDTSKSPSLTAESEDAGPPLGAVGTPVSALVDFASPAGQVDNVVDIDSGALLGIAVTAADTANGNWFISTDNGVSWSALGAVTNANARLLAADANTRVYFRPAADFNGTLTSAITFRAWDQTSGANGNLVDTSANGGTTAFSTVTDTASLVISAINDAPVLDPSKSPALAAENEDAVFPSGAVGTPVSALVDFASPAGGVDNVTDVDSGALLGIAVTAANTPSGAWFYSTDNGASWTALGAVTNANARLLAADANTRLYFQPSANFNGTIATAITFRAWDQSAGANGALADTSSNGDTTAFSTATDTASLLINAVNDSPTDIGLSSSSVDENQPSASTVGTFSSTDIDSASFTYSFVSGTGSADNGSFQITGSTLKTNEVFDFETKSSYSIRVQTNDGSGGTFQKQFTITINNVNDPPTDIQLTPSSIAENQPTGTDIGTLTSSDLDAGDTHTYVLANTGCGGGPFADNSSFQIGGAGNDKVQSAQSFNFETKSSYTICVRSTDNGGLSFDKQFVISVTNVNEAPTDISLSNNNIDENKPSASLVGNLSQVGDPDSGETYTFTLLTSGCSGSFPDSSSFQISSAQLQSAVSFNYEVKSSYTICVRVNDPGSPNLSFEKPLTISINDVNDAPVDGNESANGVGNTLLEYGSVASPSSAAKKVLAGNLLANATDEDQPAQTLSVSASDTSSANGGSVSVSSSGAFSYVPAAGFTGTDTFNYTVSDGNGGTDTSTVTVTVTARVWYVKNNAAAGGTGRSTDPFDTLAEADTAANATGDITYVYKGDGTTTGLTGGFSLLANQKLLGEPVNLVVGADTLATGTPANRPSLLGTVFLASGSRVEALDITGSAGAAIAGSNTGGSDVTNVNLSGAGGGVSLVGAAAGTFNFTNFAINTTGGTGFLVNSSGAPTINVGSGSTENVSATGGPAVDVRNGNTASSLTFDAVSSTNSSGAGINLDSNGATPFSASSGSISGAAGNAIDINGGSGNVTYPGTLGNGAGNTADITGRTGGAISLSGDINDTNDAGGGITMSGNAGGSTTFSGTTKTLNTGASAAFSSTGSGHTITFSGGGLNIDTTSGAGFTATGGGTVNVTGSVNTIDTTTGTALNVVSTNIGASGLNFKSISANGAVSGIVLNGTGSAAGLTVSGNGPTSLGGDGSGGTIQNTTGHGISLTSTRFPYFLNMNIQNTAGSGINGTQVTHFNFQFGTINNSGTGGAADDSNISFNDSTANANVTGDVHITGNVLTNARYHGVDIQNSTGTIDVADIASNTFTSSTSVASSLGSAVRLIALGSASSVANVTKASLDNNIISNFPSGAGFVVQGGNAADVGGAPAGTMGTPGSATNVISIDGNRMDGGLGGVGNQPDRFVTAAVNGRGQGNFDISNNGTLANPIAHIDGVVIELSEFGDATVTSTANNNRIVANNAVGSAGIGIGCDADSLTTTADTGTLTSTINNNNVSQTDGPGIYAIARNSSCTLNQKIQNNTVAAPATTNAARAGIRVDSGSAAGDTTLCLNISGNTTAGSTNTGTATTSPGINLRKQGTVTTTNSFAINGMAATATPSVENYVNSLNTSTSGTFGVGGTALLSATSGFSNCSLP